MAAGGEGILVATLMTVSTSSYGDWSIVTFHVAGPRCFMRTAKGDLCRRTHLLPSPNRDHQGRAGGHDRVCTFADGHTQHEAILDYAPSTRSYRYTIDGGLPVTDNRGRFAVEPTPRGAMIVWQSSFQARDPAAEGELSRVWAGMLPVVLGNLKTLIEDGSGAGRTPQTTRDPGSR